MIALLLLGGCAEHLFSSRTFSCGDLDRLVLDAPRNLSVDATDAPECEIRTNAEARGTYDGSGTLVLERLDWISIVGSYDIEATWGETLFAHSGGVYVTSEVPGSLEATGAQITCTGCELQITADRSIGLELHGAARADVCTSAAGYALLDQSTLDLSATSSDGSWNIAGTGLLVAHVPAPGFPVAVDQSVDATFSFADPDYFACCAAQGVECAVIVPPEGDVDVDADADADADTDIEPAGDQCMECHNGGPDYSGSGLEDPHPFSSVPCTVCHGGDETATTSALAHVPMPPGLASPDSDRDRRTLVGIDGYGDYSVGGLLYSPLDWLQFRNPGDLRVTRAGRGCGIAGCHDAIADRVETSPMATNVGIYSTVSFHRDSPAGVLTDFGTRGIFAFREITANPGVGVGGVGMLGAIATQQILPVFAVQSILGDQDTQGRVHLPSTLDELVHQAVEIECGSCHLGSAGENAGPGSYRSSGCTACHMPAALDGRIQTTDFMLNPAEPADPDNPSSDERIHVGRHRIRSIGSPLTAVPDEACGACHAGSGGAYFEYYGIRPDPMSDVANNSQYPQNPVTATPPLMPGGFQTWLGYRQDQLVGFEDYDGDLRDDTPPDIHMERGLGCIDCHHGVELHGPDGMVSHKEQATTVRCETCHGSIDAPPTPVPCQDWSGVGQMCVADEAGAPLRHVRVDQASYWLTSKITGNVHYIPQVVDLVTPGSGIHPITNEPLYDADADLAMAGNATGYSHVDEVECVACHASWQITCVSCHIAIDASGASPSSAQTGVLGVGTVGRAGYSTPLYFALGVGPRGKVQPFRMGTPTFFEIIDDNGDRATLALSDRNGDGNAPNVDGRGPHGALTHAPASPHTVRGSITNDMEGPRYCTACHVTAEQALELVAGYTLGEVSDGTQWLSPNNSDGNAMYVRMASGLGTGLYATDSNGCPANAYDNRADRPGCGGTAPADRWGTDAIGFELDRMVEISGIANAASFHPYTAIPAVTRDGALNTGLAGPLGSNSLQLLNDPTGGAIDSWLDANGNPQNLP
ncbi:MAG: hypothetical protein H6737_31370 [Alphaproteobacteria bacterium]|nr:hypothetical protein [Alphaproteobacteria bacterium]